jgi:hypothetical protein
VFIHGGFPISSFVMLFGLGGTFVLDWEVVWMWCTIPGISRLCVVNVVTTMAIGTDIGMHNNVIKCVNLTVQLGLN